MVHWVEYPPSYGVHPPAKTEALSTRMYVIAKMRLNNHNHLTPDAA